MSKRGCYLIAGIYGLFCALYIATGANALLSEMLPLGLIWLQLAWMGGARS